VPITPGVTYEGRDDAGTTSVTVLNVVVAATACPIILVRVGARTPAAAITGITWGTATFFRQGFIAGTNSRSELWYAVGVTPGTNNLVVTWNAATKSIAWASVSYGVEQVSGPLGNIFTASGNSATPQVGVSITDPVLADVLVKDVVSAQFNLGQTIAVAGGQTQEGNDVTLGAPAIANIQVGISRLIPTLNPTTMSWTISGGAWWTMIGTYLRPAIRYITLNWTATGPTMSLSLKPVDADLEARMKRVEALANLHERKVRSRG
jgi:hypothetical protein